MSLDALQRAFLRQHLHNTSQIVDDDGNPASFGSGGGADNSAELTDITDGRTILTGPTVADSLSTVDGILVGLETTLSPQTVEVNDADVDLNDNAVLANYIGIGVVVVSAITDNRTITLPPAGTGKYVYVVDASGDCGPTKRIIIATDGTLLPSTVEIAAPFAGVLLTGYFVSSPVKGWAVIGRHNLLEDLDAGGFRITDLGTPTDSADAATKDYVDAATTSAIEPVIAGSGDVPNVNSGVATIYDDVVPGGTLANTGDRVVAHYEGEFVAPSGAYLQLFTVAFGGIALIDGEYVYTDDGMPWSVDLTVRRSSQLDTIDWTVRLSGGETSRLYRGQISGMVDPSLDAHIVITCSSEHSPGEMVGKFHVVTPFHYDGGLIEALPDRTSWHASNNAKVFQGHWMPATAGPGYRWRRVGDLVFVTFTVEINGGESGDASNGIAIAMPDLPLPGDSAMTPIGSGSGQMNGIPSQIDASVVDLLGVPTVAVGVWDINTGGSPVGFTDGVTTGAGEQTVGAFWYEARV